MTQKILTYSFYLLFALTPLIWAPFTYELFEFNKMMFVYALTLIISASWILKMIQQKKLILKTSPLDLPLILFLFANILSTIFSIDRHVSIFGYYSRQNGGLLSLISYLLLYYALVSNFEKGQVLSFLKAAVLGGIPVALWAIPEHFGISPSCIILVGRADVSCWVQDVAARVFATIGQPNWLAAYFAMLIFPVLYFLLTSTKKIPFILNSLFLILFYSAFTFTYSRGATLGLIGGLLVFTSLWVFSAKKSKSEIRNPKQIINSNFLNSKPFRILYFGYLNLFRASRFGFRAFAGILLSFLIINLLFGSALTDFKMLNKFAPPSRPSLTTSIRSGTQLENGGTESGKIRLIVWQGALDIFKTYPLFGSGVETFAYAYYQFRPQDHNLVSEWDFLYNKAHNEFLNYLATTGLVGFLSYMAIIGTFVAWSIKILLESSRESRESSKNFLDSRLLTLVTLSAYISYLVQNFFLFSVVNTALFFYLFPAIAFITTDSIKPVRIPPILHTTYYILHTIYRRPFYTKLTQGVVIIIFGLLFFTLLKFYLADTYFAKGMKLSDTNPGKAYNNIYQATTLNSIEPFYKSELSYQAASAAVSLEEDEATLSSQLKEQADSQTSKLLLDHPQNVSYFRTAIRTYYLLSTIDQSFTGKTLETLDKAITLAPTDAKLFYNKGIILGQQEKNEEAIKALEETIKLKPNYKEAYLILGTIFAQKKEFGKARKTIEEGMFKFFPNDADGLEKLKEWQ